VQIVQVIWNSGGTFGTHVTDGEMASFYAGVTNSPFIDSLSEYNTVRVRSLDGHGYTSQRIHRGSFAGAYTILPGVTGTSLLDQDVQNELAAQIDANILPAPTVDAQNNTNTIYFVHFPNGTTVNNGGAVSCANYCAYHKFFVHNNQNVYYAIVPDLSGSACTHCAISNTTPFQQSTVIASHELGEAITDSSASGGPVTFDDAGVAQLYPLAWYDINPHVLFDTQVGEIGDMCNPRLPNPHDVKPANVIDAQGNAWWVQRLWSNLEGQCMASHLANGSWHEHGHPNVRPS
jgi:hypothetical protein